MQNQNHVTVCNIYWSSCTEYILSSSYKLQVNNFQKKIVNKRNLKLTIETLEQGMKYVQS